MHEQVHQLQFRVRAIIRRELMEEVKLYGINH